MSSDEVLTSVLQDIVFMKTVGIQPVLVHGGGPHISQEMARRGLSPKFVEGHRITDRETLEIAKDILINQISASIVKKIFELGNEAACIWENGYCPLKAEKYYVETKTEQGDLKKLDIGFVGKVTAIDKDRFLNLCNSCIIPIVPPIAKDANGDVYNVNADNVAAFIAKALGAEKLVFLSNTHGIMTQPNDELSFASTLHEDEVHALIDKKNNQRRHASQGVGLYQCSEGGGEEGSHYQRNDSARAFVGNFYRQGCRDANYCIKDGCVLP